MPYVPEASLGILWGCSHGSHDNDLWTYNLARNEWKEMLKTEPSHTEDAGVVKVKDGVLMTREERPLAQHQWGAMDYDPDRRVLWNTCVGGGGQGEDNTYWQASVLKKLRQEGDPGKHALLSKEGPPLWQYSLQTNRWKLVYTKDPDKCANYRSVIRYCPAIKKLIATPCIVEPN
jgi:hypothetical protein